MAQKIKKGDMVIVLTGKNKGQEGTVLEVWPKEQRVIVDGVNVVKKSGRPSAENPNGGIIEKLASIHVSNVAIKDPKTGKPTRVGFKIEGDKKLRVTKSSGSIL
ncbi:MAG: 50S ribosomal protein L24 [Alphaproteobacteria bacterium]|nr:50S ribosomal protein L24 [Alphaproteobacteria bacterium]